MTATLFFNFYRLGQAVRALVLFLTAFLNKPTFITFILLKKSLFNN
jgi:hypothetical protein